VGGGVLGAWAAPQNLTARRCWGLLTKTILFRPIQAGQMPDAINATINQVRRI
jgi:hypothetical protein